MTSFRCPYCKKTFEDISTNHCQHCGKDMVIPGHLRKTTLRDRKNMREKIARTAEHKRRAILNNNFNPGRNPIIIGMIIMMLAVLGDAARATRNMTELAKEAGVARDTLYTALKEDGNIQFTNLLAILNSMGLKLEVKAKAA